MKRCKTCHVYHKDGDSIHRVFCRHTQTPRLALIGQELYWLVDKATGGAARGG